jgi:glutathione peroxidase
MRFVWSVGLVLLALTLVSEAQETTQREAALPADSLYRVTTKTLEGQPADLKAFAGKVSLVVNVASRCGYTPQYEGLERLYGQLKDRGFVVLGFPSNDFGGQEPGTAAEIRQFCSLTYNVSFPMFEKVVTKRGTAQSPVYANLHKQSGELPSWNFSKYLVGKDGKVVKYYPTRVTPEDSSLRKDIETALAAK